MNWWRFIGFFGVYFLRQYWKHEKKLSRHDALVCHILLQLQVAAWQLFAVTNATADGNLVLCGTSAAGVAGAPDYLWWHEVVRPRVCFHQFLCRQQSQDWDKGRGKRECVSRQGFGDGAKGEIDELEGVRRRRSNAVITAAPWEPYPVSSRFWFVSVSQWLSVHCCLILVVLAKDNRVSATGRGLLMLLFVVRVSRTEAVRDTWPLTTLAACSDALINLGQCWSRHGFAGLPSLGAGSKSLSGGTRKSQWEWLRERSCKCSLLVGPADRWVLPSMKSAQLVIALFRLSIAVFYGPQIAWLFSIHINGLCPLLLHKGAIDWVCLMIIPTPSCIQNYKYMYVPVTTRSGLTSIHHPLLHACHHTLLHWIVTSFPVCHETWVCWVHLNFLWTWLNSQNNSCGRITLQL